MVHSSKIFMEKYMDTHAIHLDTSEIWDNPALQKSIVKHKQLNDCRECYKSSRRMAVMLTRAIIFTVCGLGLNYVVNAPEWSFLLPIASIILIPSLIAVLVALPGQRSSLLNLEKDFSSEKAFFDLIKWFSHASLEELNDYNAYAPGNVYHTFFNEYQTAKQRVTHVHH